MKYCTRLFIGILISILLIVLIVFIIKICKKKIKAKNKIVVATHASPVIRNKPLVTETTGTQGFGIDKIVDLFIIKIFDNVLKYNLSENEFYLDPNVNDMVDLCIFKICKGINIVFIINDRNIYDLGIDHEMNLAKLDKNYNLKFKISNINNIQYLVLNDIYYLNSDLKFNIKPENDSPIKIQSY